MERQYMLLSSQKFEILNHLIDYLKETGIFICDLCITNWVCL